LRKDLRCTRSFAISRTAASKSSSSHSKGENK
jgi:hypothetical protein